MGNNLIVIATMLFLLFSAAVISLMAYTMRKTDEEEKASTHATVKTPTGQGQTSKPKDDTTSLDDIQNFINSRAEIIYNGHSYTINSDCYKIGFSPSCSLMVPELNVGVHSEINYKNNTFQFSVFHGSNETYVNGKHVTYTTGAVELFNGDEIAIGSVVMEFRRHNQRQATDSGAGNPSPQAE